MSVLSLDRHRLTIVQQATATGSRSVDCTHAAMMKKKKASKYTTCASDAAAWRSTGWNANSTTVSSHRESLTRPIKFAAIARFRLRYYRHGVDAAGATPLDSQTFVWHCQKTKRSRKQCFCTKPNQNQPTMTENVKL